MGGTQRPLVTATEVAKDIQELSSEPSDPARVVSDIIEPTLSRTPQEAIARTTHMDFQRLIEQVTDTVDSDQVHQRGEGFYWEATP